ncbi:hypothetical protein [Gemmatimonas sp.]|jgi:hypothetical protein|uniref:hypothetical protein n=1 Tax=Gemmatimonas sp. TaxID=1962908 RepID=UPI0037C004FA
MRLLFRSVLLAGVATLSLAACSTDLAVTNPNNADITRALGRPSDVENLLAGGFNQVVQNTTGGSTESINSSLQVMSHENYTGLANFNMGPRAGLPRTPILNFANNPGSASVSNDWNGLSRLARSTTIALERLGTTGFTLGSAAQDLRARAYGRFVLGLALGNLALVYDSAAVVVPGGDAVPPLVRYDSVMRASLKLLDDAFADASNATASGTGGFPLPATWMNLSTGAVSADLFQRIIRSYRARFRAEVARTAAERQAVNWAQVIADAQAGITADLQIAMNPNTGWTQAWVAQHYVGTNWHVMTPMIVGMADSTGASYTAWLNQPLLSRTPFIIRTPDRRFPAGHDRGAQQASSNGGASGALLPTGVYFRNRTSANDGAAADGTWGFSWYDHARFQAFQNAARIGNFPHMVMPEMWGLIAEGAIRTGNFALAAEMINNTRVTRGGLPSVAGITDLTTPVPGDNACVPRVPVFSGGSFTTRCGNILEALKWEKRMEMAYISYGAWYFDMRGWGDLPEGTPIHFPVPWQERDVRVQKSTNMGGVGQPGGALRGTYGF